MRVLLVTYWELTQMGGIWTYVKQLADRLMALGVEVDIMGTNGAKNEVYIRNLNRSFPKDKVWPMLQAKLNPTDLPQFTADSLVAYYELNRYAFEMGAAYLGVDQYDVIHAQDPVAAVAMRRILNRNTPMVTSYHGALARETFTMLRTLTRSSRFPNICNPNADATSCHWKNEALNNPNLFWSPAIGLRAHLRPCVFPSPNSELFLML